jgi:hypothetical protein
MPVEYERKAGRALKNAEQHLSKIKTLKSSKKHQKPFI